MKYLFYVGLIFALIKCSRSYGVVPPDDSHSLGLGGAGVMLAEDMTIMPNPAALAILKKVCLGLFAESPFVLPQLTSGAALFGLPSKTGTFGFSFHNYGNAGFRESQTGMSFGKAFGNKFRAGIEISYFEVRQPAGYENLHAFIPVIGLQILPVKQVIVGFQISNPANQNYYPNGYRNISEVFRAGIGYSAGNDVLVCFEVYKESHCKSVFCGGMEYNCSNMLKIRLGLSSSQCLQYSLGLGVRKDNLVLRISISHHPVLGNSPSAGICYCL